MAGKLNYTGSTKQAREGITLLPKTTFPDTEQPLLFLLQKRGVLPLWAAGQLVDRLIERTGRMPLPAGPEQVFLSPLGTDIRILPGVRSGQGAYLPPETRLSPERITDGPEAVYRLCALLFHLLSGRILSVESLRARRADLRSGLLGAAWKWVRKLPCWPCWIKGFGWSHPAGSQIQGRCVLPWGKFRRS